MVKGCFGVLRVALTLFSLMEAQILQASDFTEIYVVIETFVKSVTTETLFKNMCKIS